jgi:hypothetical protein
MFPLDRGLASYLTLTFITALSRSRSPAVRYRTPRSFQETQAPPPCRQPARKNAMVRATCGPISACVSTLCSNSPRSRWSKSAATARGCTGPTRSIRHGTTSSIRMAFPALRSWPRQVRMGGLELAKDYFVSFPDGYRAHQIRLEGGDCSTDSFCYPSA